MRKLELTDCFAKHTNFLEKKGTVTAYSTVYAVDVAGDWAGSTVWSMSNLGSTSVKLWLVYGAVKWKVFIGLNGPMTRGKVASLKVTICPSPKD